MKKVPVVKITTPDAVGDTMTRKADRNRLRDKNRRMRRWALSALLECRSCFSRRRGQPCSLTLQPTH